MVDPQGNLINTSLGNERGRQEVMGWVPLNEHILMRRDNTSEDYTDTIYAHPGARQRGDMDAQRRV